MSHRHRYVPGISDTLEPRIVLSATAAIHHAAPFVGAVGVLGDSYSDEYQFYTPDRIHARNWVEILNATEHVSFGTFSRKSRGEPRNQGFADNWARSGATSQDMIANQLPGLTAQVAAGKVKYAAIFIGANDFLHLAMLSGRIAPADAPAYLAQTTTQLEANFSQAVNTLLAANPNVRLIVSTLPDVSVFPVAQAAEAANPGSSVLFEGIIQAIKQFDATVVSIANSNSRIALVDLAAITGQVTGNSTGTFSFGGQTINLKTPGDDYHDFFLGDGVHAGTVAQGIIAEEFALAVDQKFNVNLAPPSPQAIIRYAAAIERTTSHKT